MFIVAIILALIAFVIFFVTAKFKQDAVKLKAKYDVGDEYQKRALSEQIKTARSATLGGKIVGAVFVIAALFFLFFSSFYTQDVGEAKVLKDWTGNIVGQDITAGADFKAPWVDTADFDIRNQMAAYIGNGQDNYNGQQPNGPQITVQDKEGVSANLDVVVVYSIKPGAVTDIYREYLNQDNFKTRLIEQDIRSVVRNVPASYATLELLNSREDVGTDIQNSLEKRWSEKGVIVESVSLQEIRYSDEVKKNFDAAQSARIEVEKATAELAKAKVDAQQKVEIAKAEAEANNLLTQSLTDQVLKQRYLDTLSKLAAKGNVVVVPEGFNGLVNVK